MVRPSRRAWRTALSALAGGGLTAASLGGHLAPGAFAATVPAGTTTPAEGSQAPASTTSSPQSSTSTSTTPSSGTSSSEVNSPPAPTSTVSEGAGEEAPAVVLQRKQQTSPSVRSGVSATTPKSSAKVQGATGASGAPKGATALGPNEVALAPQLVAGQSGALAALAGVGGVASEQALASYRIPLFLLPIYQAAAVQYGVPWQVLAAINEIETDYGSDLSVSTAGAVGWMQFMPSTWLQYGVDALNAGYADPYNPVDSIFAAARYLRAAGAATDLNSAIFSYNHSDEYVSSVLLRAKLISTLPKSVIATLTGLIDGRLPVAGAGVTWSAPIAEAATSQSSATANATAVAPQAAAAAAQGPKFVDLTSPPKAAVVAVQDGRIVKLGSSHKLGKFVILQDVYGDLFTYAGLGSIAPSFRPSKEAHTSVRTVAEVAGTRDRAPSEPASAGTQPPLTLLVKAPTGLIAAVEGSAEAGNQGLVVGGTSESVPPGMGKVRLFAHPGNPDALAAAAAARIERTRRASAAKAPLPLIRGSVVEEGTVLGHVGGAPGSKIGHLRFAIQPAGDASTIDPSAILANWKQLGSALHPEGVKGEPSLLGATASDAFLLSKSQLEREILADPGLAMPACARAEVASGAIDRRVMAVLVFLSRSGLKPTVDTLRCGDGSYAISGYVTAGHLGDGVAISHINGVPVAGHQGPGSITDTAIRTLLSLQGEFAPHQIVSLMQYPGAASTLARSDHSDYIEIDFLRSPRHVNPHAGGADAHSAGAGRTAPSPIAASGELSATQWNQLLTRIAALPVPVVGGKPSSSAIPDPSKRP